MDEPIRVGCLVGLGLMGLILVLPNTVITGHNNVVRAFNSIDWTNFSAFRQSLWAWLRHGSSLREGLMWVFGLGYGALVWQWMAQMHDWPRFLSGRRLWAVSSAYFLVLLSVFIYLAARQENVVSASQMGIILIPVIFLALTLPLWWFRMKSRS